MRARTASGSGDASGALLPPRRASRHALWRPRPRCSLLLAQRTQHIHLLLFNSLRLIEEVCMLDQFSGGRLELGVGCGIAPARRDPRNISKTLAILVSGLTSMTAGIRGPGILPADPGGTPEILNGMRRRQSSASCAGWPSPRAMIWRGRSLATAHKD